jgi:prepilin-type N-terminal cleavage/methylation domain-containing protein
MKAKDRGFSLIELAVAIFILSLLLGSLLLPLATQVERRQVNETEKALSDIRDALVGYAVAQASAHLPCPDRISGGVGGANDTANDGIEDFGATGMCAVSDGNIPWVTLGVNATDAWGNRFRYLVTPAFSNRPPAAVMTLTSTGIINICASNPSSATCGGTVYVASNVPAVIISHGKNGYGALNGSSNIQIPTAGASTHELENVGGTYLNTIVSKIQSDAPGQQFDDVVSWLSAHLLFNRLIAAGKLP